MFKKVIYFLFLLYFTGVSTSYSQQQGGGLGQVTPQLPSFIFPSGQLRAAQPSSAPSTGQPQLTPAQADAARNLTPEQQRAVQSELSRTGGTLTPEAIDKLKAKPEFKGLTPEEVLKGKELLEKKEKSVERKETEKKETSGIKEKRVIGGDFKDKSLFDRFRFIGEYQDIPLDIKPFGYEIFQEAAVRVVTDTKDIPVPSKYVIGPGDEVKILMWGRVNAQLNLVVDRNGNITVPQIGPIPVAGLTFEDMSKHLIKQSEQIVGANIDITMGALKTMSIFVLGDVRRPGAYTIGSFATVTDALLVAGGPTGIGTMRNIQVRRKDKVIVTLDLYDLFLKGDKSRDVILQAGDVVFVPVAGTVVGIAGNVRRPAVYELRDKFDMQTLFDLAGGMIPTAYTQQIQIERIVKNERQIVIDIDDRNLTKSAHILLQDADFVKVFNIVDMAANVVNLFGNVKKPGKYEYKPGMTIKDILKNEGELLSETYYDYALIKRLEPPLLQTSLMPFSLKMLFTTPFNIDLKPMDNIYIFSKWFFFDKPRVTVEGEVRGFPYTAAEDGRKTGEKQQARLERDTQSLEEYRRTTGERDGRTTGERDGRTTGERDGRTTGEKQTRLERDAQALDEFRSASGERQRVRITRDEKGNLVETPAGSVLERQLTEVEKMIVEIPWKENMTVRDAILAAGGLTREAYPNEAELYSTDIVTKKVTLRRFDLKKAMSGYPEDNIQLKDFDRIVVHSLQGYTYKKVVFADGEVFKPGTYPYAEKMTVKDLVFAAGNILDSAYLDDADVSFQIIEEGKSATVQHRQINIKKALQDDPEHNLQLLPYSRIFVKKIPQWRYEKFVTMSGEVNFPGRYVISKGEKLSSLIERAGGYTDKAYLRGAYFMRERVRTLQQRTLNEMIIRLEKDLMAESTLRLSTALSAEEVSGLQMQQQGSQRLVDALKKTEVTGRMTVRLANIRLLKGSEYDIELEDNDILFIPTRLDAVNVSGAVLSQGSYIYLDKLNYSDYIDRAGGYSKFADSKNIFVLKVDGSAARIQGGFFNWSSSRDRWEVNGFDDEVKTIEPGDTIVVPEKLQATAWLRGLRDVTQILAQVGIFASSINYLFGK